MKELKEKKYEEITGLSDIEFNEMIISEEDDNSHEEQMEVNETEDTGPESPDESKYIVDDFDDSSEMTAPPVLKTASIPVPKPEQKPEVRSDDSNKPPVHDKITQPDPEAEKSAAPVESSITFSIPDEVRNKLADNVDLGVIGSIDLNEAEMIANEDLLFLTEDDLIEGIEEFELIPLEKVQPKKAEDTLEDEEAASVEKAEVQPEPKAEVVFESGEDKTDTIQLEQAEETVAVDQTTEKHIEDEISRVSETAEEELSPEQKTLTEESQESHDLTADLPETPFEKTEPELTEKIFISENKEEESEETDFFEPDAGKNESESESAKDISNEEELFSEFIHDEITHELTGKEKKEVLLTEDQQFREEEIFETESKETFPLRRKPGFRPEKEVLSENLVAIETNEKNVLFSDDSIVDKPRIDKREIFEENELERITSEINEMSEGRVVVLEEAEEEDDQELIANILQGTTSTFEDLLLDFEDIEYKYQDDEIDFIDSAIIEEDYSRYIKEIDEYYGIEQASLSSPTMELFGLTSLEISFVEETLFESEYRDVDLDQMYELISVDFSKRRRGAGAELNYNYIEASYGSLAVDEKFSIEEDISSTSALIFEEDVERIKQLLGRPVREIEETFRPKEEPEFKPEAAKQAEEAGVVPVAEESISDQKDTEIEQIETEEIIDITDDIIIIEDELDVDRFVRNFPEKKQDDLRVLLAYLDGLFEKLPEPAIRKFANSEYFDLYVKVLSDMGI